MTSHPLEPLDAQEVQEAIRLLRESGLLTPRTRIISIQLKEPPKHLVHAWAPQSPSVDRCAEATLFDNAANQGSSVALNLTISELIGITRGPAGAQTTLSADEQIECEQTVLASTGRPIQN